MCSKIKFLIFSPTTNLILVPLSQSQQIETSFFYLTMWNLFKFILYFFSSLPIHSQPTALLHNLTLKYIHNLPLFIIATATPDAPAIILSSLVTVAIIYVSPHFSSSLALLLVILNAAPRMIVLQITQIISLLSSNPSNDFPSPRASQCLYTDLQGPRWSASHFTPQIISPLTVTQILSISVIQTSLAFAFDLLLGMILPRYLKGLFL